MMKLGEPVRTSQDFSLANCPKSADSPPIRTNLSKTMSTREDLNKVEVNSEQTFPNPDAANPFLPT